MPVNPGTLGSVVVAAAPAMVSQMKCTGVNAGAGCNVSAGVMGMVGVEAGGNASLILGVPVAPAWRACVGARLSAENFCAPRWGSRRSRSAWTCKISTEDSIPLMLSRIWSS